MPISGYFYKDDPLIQAALDQELIYGFVEKPFSHTEIIAAIENALSSPNVASRAAERGMSSEPSAFEISYAHSHGSGDAFMFYGLATMKLRSRLVAIRHVLLASGSRVGDGSGPLLIATRPFAPEEIEGKRIAVSGMLTTEYLAINTRPNTAAANCFMCHTCRSCGRIISTMSLKSAAFVNLIWPLSML